MGVIPIHPPGSLPEPATPALDGQHWWHARTSVLEGQRQAYADEVAGKDRTIAEQAATITRLREDLAQAGLAIDALTAPAPSSDEPLGEVTVTGTPDGDGECWHFVVGEDEYRRVVGETTYKAEMDFRRAVQGDEWAPQQGVFHLAPCDLLRATGVYGADPVTLHVQARKPT